MVSEQALKIVWTIETGDFMKSHIQKVSIVGLHEKFDIEQSFHPGINVIYGENGEFKTTFLHILANFLNKDFKKFFDIRFSKISIDFKDEISYQLIWDKDQEILELKSDDKRRGFIFSRENQSPPIEEIVFPRAAYFPTFRSIVEAWFAYESKGVNNAKASVKDVKKDISGFLREIFGGFVPNINFLSLPEIISKVNEKMFESGRVAIQVDQKLTGEMASKISDIVILPEEKNISEILEPYDMKRIPIENHELITYIISLIKKINVIPVGLYLGLPKSIKQKIDSIDLNKEDIGREEYRRIIGLMKIYKETLEKELQEVNNLFLKFELYLDSLNSFLRGKRVVIESRSFDYFDPVLCLKYEDGEVSSNEFFGEDKNSLEEEKGNNSMFTDFKGLSSGERQIASLLYSAHISSQETILIDEPEISLHTSWQEKLLNELQIQTGGKQIIVCTHSPSIGADYIDDVQNMNISETKVEEDVDKVEENNQETNNEDEDFAAYKEAEYYEES